MKQLSRLERKNIITFCNIPIFYRNKSILLVLHIFFILKGEREGNEKDIVRAFIQYKALE